MEEYLRSCERAVKSPAVLHVVLGNESCDLDSMVSALALAFFLSKTAGSEAVVLPVLNIRRSELALRSDNLFLLREARVPPELLLFREQLDLQALHAAKRLSLTLVDHNVLPSSDSHLEGAVVEVIDHHLLERQSSLTCPITVEMVGSCATLVTERILKEAPQVLDQQIAQLLYAAIVVDCVNMAPAAGKVTPKDSRFAAALEARFPSLPPRGALFQALQQAKFDVSGLDTEQMLLKDMKALKDVLHLAISVLYIPLEEFLRRAELEAELSAFCEKFGFDLLLLMTISFSETQEPIRELAVFSHSATCREQVSQYLEQARSPALNLCPISTPHPHLLAYHQGNSLVSRKKLLPLVKDFLREQVEDGFPGDMEAESAVPPTPMNSLVEGCPLDGGLPGISAQALQERFSQMDGADL